MDSETLTLIGFLKHRWYYEVYCLNTNIIIGRSHKRPRKLRDTMCGDISDNSYLGYDFFNPSVCGCSNCSALANLIMDYGYSIEDIARDLGVIG